MKFTKCLRQHTANARHSPSRHKYSTVTALLFQGSLCALGRNLVDRVDFKIMVEKLKFSQKWPNIVHKTAMGRQIVVYGTP